MEDVDTKEWYSVSVPSVQTANRISWSEDHKMSLITTSALHIMEVNPNPSFTASDINFKRSVISPSNDTPTGETGIDVNNLQCKLDMQDLYHLVLDMKLSPRTRDARSPEPHFSHCCWSPAGMFQEHRCMIASLTNLGCLKLHVPYFTTWLEPADVSEVWVNHCKLQWQDEDVPSDEIPLFALLKRRVHLIKFNVMIWNDKIIEIKGKRHSIMITISHNGTLGVWEIPQLVSLASYSEDYKPTLINTFETNVYCATVLHWLWWDEKKFSIVIGNFEGYVKIATLAFDGGDISLLCIKDIWNFKDRMKVSCIKSLPASSLHSGEERIIGVAKNDYFLVFLVSEDGVKASCHERVGSLTITGMEIKNEESFLVCTLPGHIFIYSVKIDHSFDGAQFTLQSKVFKTNISWNGVSCFGITKSPFTNLWAVVTSICKLYDHLVIRRPSQIVLMSLKGIPDPVDQIKATQLKPRHVWECLEILRLSYIKHQEPANLTYSHCPDDLETLSTNQLQLELWRCRMVLAKVSAADLRAQQTEASAFVTLIEELLLCRHACDRIRKLTAKHNEESLDEKSLISLGLLRSWLQVWLSHNVASNSEQTEREDKKIKVDSCGSEVSVVGMEFINTGENTESENSSSLNVDTSENIEQTSAKEFLDVDESSSSSECTSVSSFSGKTAPGQPNKRVSPLFLKIKLTGTRDLVTEVLALPLVPGVPEKEICDFCEQEIQMDCDRRFSVCPANHRMSRCSECLLRCRRIPQQLCLVCPVVTCADTGHQSHCIFCDSLLILDEKFTVPPTFKSRPPEKVPKEDTEETEETEETEDSPIKNESVAEDEPMEFDA